MGRTPLLFILVMLSVALPLLAVPQQQESLGEVARQVREQRAKDTKKATKVFTNDDLPARPPGGTAAQATEPSKPAEPTAQPTNPPSPKETSSQPGPPSDKIKTRDYWQAKFKAARQALAAAKEQQQLVEDELNLLQVQQLRELDPSVRQDLANRIQAKQTDIDAKKAATAAAQKDLDALEKDFKDSGAPEDWRPTD
jgi:hypothetical protein